MHRHLLILTALVALSATDRHALAALLRVDINDRTAGDPTPGDAANTAPGFSPYVMSGSPSSTGVVDGYTVTFDVFDDGDPNDGGAAGNQVGQMDDRDRPSPVGAPTLNQLYDDFLFAGGSAGPTGGLDLRISGGALQPFTRYRVSLYSFDGISATGASAFPQRIADWFDGNNSDELVTRVEFFTNQHPTSDDQYKFTGTALTDGAGMLLLKGRRVTAQDIANDLSVYVNGVVVEEVPEPAALAIIAVAVFGLVQARSRRKEMHDGEV
jgi:hypothetical protein